ncbi:acid protease [Lentithecium fluviatile CBS 122367]|uniref:Acid protease n=1 Tax=Lentithecium fluviatile CBS 122367 TaxID=1168545 RepID=A0A6G1ITM0_9PLEO|nr:acid protease [Lentithecium fluviatile CBS 122367]
MRAFGHRTAVFLWTLLSVVTGLVLTGEEAVQSAHPAQKRWSKEGPHALKRRQANDTIAAPIVASVSQYWEGNDGPWSSFAIQIGNKPQNIRVLPSTASTSTWAVYAEGCPSDAPSDCPDSRGGTFNPNNSLTRVPNSIFQLGVEENLDFQVFGDFGFDTVTLGWQGSGGPSVDHSIVAGIADTTFTWLGVLGLNPRPTNFSTFPNNPQVSFIQALRNQNSIPSLSWAYTAGAQYRLNKVYGSLILGGYDTARFTKPSDTSTDLTFPFYTDIARDLLVGITSITTDKTTSSSSETKLLDSSIFAMLDSTIPYFYLPEAVCAAFESAFGLTYNTTSDLYTLNSTQHATLTKLNPSITFTLSPEVPAKSSDQAVQITLPYSAFDLNVSWPYAEESTAYFPLKRATNDTQYTLGRAFFQEAYVIADYERQNFSVWPCKWDSNTNNANVVAILSTDASTNNTDSTSGTNTSSGSSKKGLSTGATAGIGIGAALGVVALAASLWFFLLKPRRAQKQRAAELEAREPHVELGPHGSGLSSYYPNKDVNAELDSRPRHEMPDHDTKFGILEAPGERPKYEMDGTGTPTELDGGVGGKGNRGVVHEMDAQPAGGKLASWLKMERGPDRERDGGGSYFPEQAGRGGG